MKVNIANFNIVTDCKNIILQNGDSLSLELDDIESKLENIDHVVTDLKRKFPNIFELDEISEKLSNVISNISEINE